MDPLTPNQQSNKRERWIQIGKSRHRIANDLDAKLDVIAEAFGHSRKEDSLFFAASFGARVLLMLNLVQLINVRSEPMQEMTRLPLVENRARMCVAGER